MSKYGLKVVNLGIRSFADGVRTQEILRQRVIADSNKVLQPASQSDSNVNKGGISSILKFEKSKDFENVLILTEHWPVYTAGLRDEAFTDRDEKRLKALGAEVFRTNRGGLATFHGPGQLVAYPIVNLKQLGIGLKEYVHKLEKTIADLCQQYSIKAETNDNVGVWVNHRKIASIGVHAKRHVTMHGVSVNCNNELSWFDHITPCGLEGIEMTSLTKEIGKAIRVSETGMNFLNCFATNFNFDISSDSDYIPAALERPKGKCDIAATQV